MTSREHQNFTYTFDISQASANLLNNEQHCTEVIQKMIVAAGMTEIQTITHQFSPQGVSVVTLLAESHIALHTWPELGTGYVTLTTCKRPGDHFVSEARGLLQTTLNAEQIKVQEF